MATTKNITMKQFNGTDYDTLYPKTVAAQIDDVYSKNETYPKSQLYTQSQLYTRQQILSNATKTLYGLGSSAIPDDVFSWIAQEAPRIETGSYVGTGTCGPDNPNSLTLPFSPKVLAIAPADSGIHFGDTNTETFFHESSIWLVGTSYTELRADTSSYMAGKCYFTVSGNSISWHSDKTNYPETQMNTAGTKYAYIAIG